MRHVRRRFGKLLLGAAIALVATGACGHRGDPLPPKRHTPPPLSEFRLAQRGATLEMSVLAPAASVDGLPYDSVAVEFLYVEGAKDLEKVGSKRQLEAEPRQRVVETLPLPAPGAMARAAARGVFGKERGPRTLIMALVTQPEVPAPRELAASLTEQGVELAWAGDLPAHADATVPPPRIPGMTVARPASGATAPVPGSSASPPGPSAQGPPAAPQAEAAKPDGGKPAADTPGADKPASEKGEKKKDEPLVGFLVYRRAGSAAYAAPLTPRLHEAKGLKDTTAPEGQKVCYVVRAVASHEPLVESAASNEACLDVRDIAAPAVPTGLAVLPRERGLELVWTPNAEEDLALYRVYRAGPGEARKRLAEVEAGLATWTDTNAKPGVTYRYTLTAVDRSGNESPETAAVEANRE